LNFVDTASFYQKHLDGVSRSFALCISRLDEPLRAWVGLTYLLCRVLDTIEDADWTNASEQLLAYAAFQKFLVSDFSSQEYQIWLRSFPKNLPQGEAELLTEGERLFTDYRALPVNIRTVLARLLTTMSEGMKYFSKRKSHGVLQLKTLQEVNQYCLFVAGVVGEALSQLLQHFDEKIKLSREWLLDAHHFGLFLQKVNLLKDQKQDEVEGRRLIPERSSVYESLGENAEGALRYIEAIDVRHHSYRVFCLWSFFLGLRTLPILRDNFTEAAEVVGSKVLNNKILKLRREDAVALFKKVEDAAREPKMIRKVYDLLVKEAGLISPSVVTTLTHETVESLRYYDGLLQPQDVLRLNLR